jgi:hypothetical protein
VHQSSAQACRRPCGGGHLQACHNPDKLRALKPLAAQVSASRATARDERRDRLIGQLRRTASAGQRPARTSPPVREILLETLAYFRWPQNAGFLEEYLLAKHQLQLDSRAFAPLRLAGRPGSAEASYVGPRSPVDALLEKYAQDILDTEPLSASASDTEFRAWRSDVRERVGALIGENRRGDEPDRKQTARQLASLTDRERVWGRAAGIKAKTNVNRRPSTSASGGT